MQKSKREKNNNQYVPKKKLKQPELTQTSKIHNKQPNNLTHINTSMLLSRLQTAQRDAYFLFTNILT